jgi:hypothetical protein
MQVLFPAASIFFWLESSNAASFIRQSLWLYPIVEIVHIAGFAVLVGAALLFDVRLLGFSKKIPVKECVGYFIFWARLSLFAVIPSGFILFMVDATTLVLNPVFLLKLVLIGVAFVNALIFHQFTLKSVSQWNVNLQTPKAAKMSGLISIILWLAVISCGRLIAYF